MTVPMIKSIGDVPYPIDTHSDAFSPLLTAGASLGITGNGPTESAAWLQRVSTADGPTTVKSIHGRTLRWNQLMQNGDFASATGWGGDYATVSVADNTLSMSPSESGRSSFGIRGLNAADMQVVGHKYLLLVNVKSSKACMITTQIYNVNTVTDVGASTWEHIGKFLTLTTTTTGYRVRLMATLSSGTFDTTDIVQVKNFQLFDLTAMFGAGFEPSTVAEFEALYPLPYYAYDAGSLLPVNMTGIATEDADGNPLQTRSIPAGTLRSAGTVYDEQTETERIVRVGERAYQSGDESDPTVTTDGTITYYPLATPTVTTYDPPLNLTYRTTTGGTERIMVPAGENSAPPTIVAAQGYTAESLRDAALSCIAPVENGKASTNYGVGAYLVHGGQLCKVTTAIATGESITIGTNVTATTVMAEILSLVQ